VRRPEVDALRTEIARLRTENDKLRQALAIADKGASPERVANCSGFTGGAGAQMDADYCRRQAEKKVATYEGCLNELAESRRHSFGMDMVNRHALTYR
jgi:hypothetical protein